MVWIDRQRRRSLQSLVIIYWCINISYWCIAIAIYCIGIFCTFRQDLCAVTINNSLEIVLPDSVQVNTPFFIVAIWIGISTANGTASTSDFWIGFGAICGEGSHISNIWIVANDAGITSKLVSIQQENININQPKERGREGASQKITVQQ